MPRRANLAVAIQEPSAPQQDTQAENLAILRTQWRWAAFTQFFFTFAPLFALNDVSVSDIEQDLVCNTRLVLPRIMQKLLFSLSYDRKVSVHNWQTALRKQYTKRAPFSNPIGPAPPASIPLRDDDMGQDAEQSTSEQADDRNEKDYPPIASKAGVSIGNINSAAPTPSNELNSTRQSSLTQDRRASSTFNDIDNDLHLQQKSTDWFDLPMLAKLESMHTVAEWHFQNPTKLRTIMKSDDEFATWRIEPIGYDSKGNAYWLIGGWCYGLGRMHLKLILDPADRLWFQRAPPKPPKPKTLKRKRPSQKASEKKETSSLSAQNAKRLRISPPEKPSVTPSSDRQSRAAKDQAKKRLDAQAKELAQLNRQAALANPGSRRQASLRSATTVILPVMGTRSSARLRGTQDDEWQPIPQEWLKEYKPAGTSRRLEVKTGLETDEDSVSDLTELSDDDSEPSSLPLKQGSNGPTDDEEHEHGVPEQEPLPEDFVEWEMICSTLQEWEHIAEQFEKATHYSERALYKVLVNDIVPVITHEMRETDRKRQLEEAIVHRKRSSRIALRESEKEEARMVAVRKQEEDEKMSRARRLEARKQREEEERIKREHARELRRKERDAKEETKLEAEETSVRTGKKRKSNSPVRDTNAQKTNGKDIGTGSRTPVGEDWELACEICNRQGINLDDGTPMMSCGVCSKWQHIQCHNRADRLAGRPRRNWNSEEFICSRCRAAQQVQYNNHQSPRSKPVSLQNVRLPPFQGHAPSQLNPPSGSSSIYHQDYRNSSHYLSGYNNPLMQNHSGRPNGQQYPNGQYPSSLAGHSVLSFSHYQPAQHAFLPSAPNKTSHPNAQSLYAHTNNTFQPHHHDHSTPQTSAWSANVAQSPENSAHPDVATTLSIPSYMPSNHDLKPVHTYSNHEPQTSYTRYSTDNPTGYKQPVPYQTSSRQ